MSSLDFLWLWPLLVAYWSWVDGCVLCRLVYSLCFRCVVLTKVLRSMLLSSDCEAEGIPRSVGAAELVHSTHLGLPLLPVLSSLDGKSLF